MTLGGVGRNLAAALELLGLEPLFLTSLANDNLAEFARNQMAKFGFQLDSKWPRMQIIRSKSDSSCFALVLIDSLSGQCQYVIANLDATGAISRENLHHLPLDPAGQTLEQHLERAPLMVLDANLSAHTTSHLMELCTQKRVPIFLEPTDVVCLAPLVSCLRNISRAKPQSLRSLAFLSPNEVELRELVRLFEFTNETGGQAGAQADDVESMAQKLMAKHLPHLKCLLVTMDKRGVLVAARTCGEHDDLDNCKLINGPLGEQKGQHLSFKHYKPAQIIEKPLSASGAGDCFAAGFISGLIDGLPLKACVELAFSASACSLHHRSTVPLALKDLARKSTIESTPRE